MKPFFGLAACVTICFCFVGCTCGRGYYGYYDSDQGLVYPTSLRTGLQRIFRIGRKEKAPPVPGTQFSPHAMPYAPGMVGVGPQHGYICKHGHYHPGRSHSHQHLPVGLPAQYPQGLEMAGQVPGCCQGMEYPIGCGICSACCDPCGAVLAPGCEVCGTVADCCPTGGAVLPGGFEMSCSNCSAVPEVVEGGCSSCSTPQPEPAVGCSTCAAGGAVESSGCTSCSGVPGASVGGAGNGSPMPGTCTGCSSGQMTPTPATGPVPAPATTEPAPAPPAQTSQLLVPPATFPQFLSVPGTQPVGAGEVRQANHTTWVPRHQ